MIEKVLKLTTIFVFLLSHNYVSAGYGGCEVNSTHIFCDRRSSENPLKSLQSAFSAQIDTVIVHNAEIDLTDDQFGEAKSLPSVSLMNLTDNSIRRIGRRGFEKVHNLQFLYLSRNLISSAQPDPFMSLSRLEILEMNNALGIMSNEEREELLRNLFHSRNDFTHLAEIQLNENLIESLHAKTFCGVEGLKRLELSNNKLTNLDFARKCFGELKALFVAGNQITKIPDAIWEWMPVLTSLDLSNNPLHCDCSIVEFVKADDVSFINQGKTFCASPPELKGKNVFDLPRDFCKRGSDGSFFELLLLFLIAAGVLFAYRRYRIRLERSSKIVEYHNIDNAVEPEFV